MVVMFEYSHQMLIKNRSFIDGTLTVTERGIEATPSTHEEKGKRRPGKRSVCSLGSVSEVVRSGVCVVKSNTVR